MQSQSFFNSDLFFNTIALLFFAELLTGLVQVIGAIIRTISKINKDEPLGHLKTYWVIVGIYFLVLGILYGYGQYLHKSLDLNSSESIQDYILCTRYLTMAFPIWLFTAWGIAIWYNIKIVFNRQPKITEHVG